MSGPARVVIGRKRGAPPPDALVLERPGKRLHSEIGGIQYVRQKSDNGDEGVNGSGAESMQGAEGGNVSGGNGGGTQSQSEIKQRRMFHLKRSAVDDSGGIRRQKRKHDDVATFVERNVSHTKMRTVPEMNETSPSKPYATPEAPFKRPGRRAAVKINGDASFSTTAHKTQADHAVANSLHEFAQHVAATEAKPKTQTVATPKLPPHRSRELHRQSALRNATKNVVDQDGDADMEDEADYVYDTYILAPSSSAGAVQADAHNALGNVGYLVIAEEDQDVWETYLEDEPSDKDWNSDEEDENAEDWYGADYPDEELASDDEYGRSNDHGFRTYGAADDEEWDADTGNFSDEEYDRQMHPWKKMSL